MLLFKERTSAIVPEEDEGAGGGEGPADGAGGLEPPEDERADGGGASSQEQ